LNLFESEEENETQSIINNKDNDKAYEKAIAKDNDKDKYVRN